MALISNGDQVLTKNVYNSDETVLWEGVPNSSSYVITLSENMNNFDYIAIVWKSYERVFRQEIVANTSTQAIILGSVYTLTDGNAEKSLTTWSTSDGLSYQWRATVHSLFLTSQSSAWNENVVPLKIVGVNRKEGV